MKARKWLLTVAIAALPATMHAQSPFFFGLECKTGNFWSGFLGWPTNYINSAIAVHRAKSALQNTGQASGHWEGNTFYYDDSRDAAWMGQIFAMGFNSTLGAYNFRHMSVSNNGQKIDFDGNSFWGLHAEDLFRDFEYSMRLGFQPVQVPVGIYARIGYRHQNFNTRMTETDSWTKHRVDCVRPGVGIRISPLDNLIGKFCPVFELGSTYDMYIGYKGAYNNEKDQLNNGVSISAGVGVKMRNGAVLVLKADKQNYDLFNKDFEVNGVKPYENVTTKQINFTASFTWGI